MQDLVDSTIYNGQRSNSDVPVASPFHTSNAVLIIPSTAHILRPSRSNLSLLMSHRSLLCSPKKSRGSTIPRSLQPWRLL